MLVQEGDVILYGFLEAEGQATEGMFEGFFVAAVQTQVEVIGGIDANDGVLQHVQLTSLDMFACPLVELLDWRRW